MPRPASRLVAPDASAQIPTPTLPPILPGKSPTPTPTPTKSPDKDKDNDNDNDNDGKNNDNDNDNDGNNNDGGRNSNRNNRNDGPGNNNRSKNPRTRKQREKDEKPDKVKAPKPPKGVVRIPGSYTTDRLVSFAARLRALGTPAQTVVSRVFQPFIIGGEAAWIDTWGAPRYGPGPIVRTHEGQDVFCDFGSPVLATEPGQIEFDDGGLGGKVARLYRSDGSYWYYAHLSDFNTQDFSNGDTVKVGDIIGYCGNTGNALTTPPHVHFGWYQPNGESRNPMRHLITWLAEAERNAGFTVTKETGRRVRQIEPLTLARRFGDAFAPDLSVLGISGESLWATGSSPASGTLDLAQAALQAALSEGISTGTANAPQAGNPVSGQTDEASAAEELDPNSELSRLINGDAETSEAAD